MKRFQCEECGCREYLDIEGSGKDEVGEFQDYVCDECGGITRVYDKEYNVIHLKID